MREYLGIIDLFVIAVIMFGPALYSSWQAGPAETEEGTDVCTFSARENISAAIFQVIQLAAAIVYLHMRGLNPYRADFHISPKSVLVSVALFCLFGLCMDLITSCKSGFQWIPDILRNHVPILSAAEDVDLSLVVFSLLNGFYEEFFFLVLCTWVEPRYSLPALMLSIAIRVLIHSYQGWGTAVAIGVGMGAVQYLLFTGVSDNLFLYAFSHGLADVFGLSLFNLL